MSKHWSLAISRFALFLAVAVLGGASCAVDAPPPVLAEHASEIYECPVLSPFSASCAICGDGRCDAGEISWCPEDCGPTLEWNALPQAWHENVELQSGDLETFVPQGTPVPSARFVEAMTFSPNGDFSILRLSPNDAHYWAYGSWSRSGSNLTVTFYDRRLGTLQEHYAVTELTYGRFRFYRF